MIQVGGYFITGFLILAILATGLFIVMQQVDMDWGLLIPSTNPNPTAMPAEPAIFVVEEPKVIEPNKLINNGNSAEHVIHEDLNNDIAEKSHASARHSEEAESVRRCLNNNGSMHIFFNPSTNRYANICLMPDHKYGLQISEMYGDKLEEVTSFIKNKFKTWEQMARYLENGGYTNMIR